MEYHRVKISTTIPTDDADSLRTALGEAGAGVVGNYTFCSFTTPGIGRFKPNQQASPHIGSAGQLEAVKEERVEVVCDKAIAKRVIAALQAVHPYEEVIFEVTPLLDLDQL